MRALASEIRKLTTTRTAPITLLIMTATGAVGAYVMTQPIAPGAWAGPDRSPFLGTFIMLLGVVAYVGGARIVTDEFRYGTAGTTALATPRRGRIVRAKTAAGLMLGAAGGLLAGLAITAIIVPWSGTHVPAIAPADLAPMLARLTLATALFAAIGVGVGAAIRHQVAAIVGGVVFFLIGDQILSGLLRDSAWILPVEAAAGFVGAAAEGLAGRTTGGLLALGYATAAVLAGRVALGRADLGS